MSPAASCEAHTSLCASGRLRSGQHGTCDERRAVFIRIAAKSGRGGSWKGSESFLSCYKKLVACKSIRFRRTNLALVHLSKSSPSFLTRSGHQEFRYKMHACDLVPENPCRSGKSTKFFSGLALQLASPMLTRWFRVTRKPTSSWSCAQEELSKIGSRTKDHRAEP